MQDNNIYEAEISCDYREWGRYNVYMTLVSYDNSGIQLAVSHVGNGRGPGNLSDRSVRLCITGAPCAYCRLYVHIIPNTLPLSTVIGQSPPFEVAISLRCNSGSPRVLLREVNQWGGADFLFRLPVEE